MAEVFAPGRVLGDRYRLDHKLARGGMATVWVAEDPLLSRNVAVKLLHPELAVDDGLRARFRNEAIAAARLTHPGIVATYDTGDDDGVAYIVMELVDGFNLRHILDRNGRLAVGDAVNIGSQVAEALDHAHRHGLVHRDVKPANVLVQPDGRVKVTDFGIAKATGTDDLTRTGTVIGTARYLAPEQVNGETVDARADVYALGLVLYEMLTGRPPFGGDTDVATAVARLTSTPDPIRSLRPEVPRTVEDVVARSLARDPEYRYSTARELRDALTASVKAPAAPGMRTPPPVRSAPAPTTSTGPPTPPPRLADPQASGPLRPIPSASRRHTPSRPARWPWALLALLLVGAAIAGYFVATRGDGNNGGAAGAGTGDASALQLVSATDFDPQGDGEESSSEVGNLIDTSAGTFWTTEDYKAPERDFGGAKDGVGLVLELDGTRVVQAVQAAADESGWDADVYVSESTHDDLAGWGSPAATGTDLGTDATLTLDPAASGRFVLLWLTRLPPDGNLGIAEVAVEGS